MVEVFVLYYTRGDRTKAMAEAIAEGAKGVEGASAKVKRVDYATTADFIDSDAVAFVRAAPPGDRYALVVIDPPTFSASKRTEDVFDVQRGYAELLTATAKRMSPGGVIYFSTNFRKFKFDAADLPGLEAVEITAKTIPDDFRNKRIHRCWRMVVG